MTYTLKVCNGGNNAKSYQNPPTSAIDRAIDDLVPAIYHFAILEAEPAVEKYAYIQTLIECEGRFKGQYLVEARYLFAGDFKHYRTRTKDAAEVKSVFQKFAEGIAPNVTGWEDITAKLVAAAG